MGCVGDDMVVALVEGDLPADRKEAIQTHLDDCDACRELVAHAAHALIPTVDEGLPPDPALEATHPSEMDLGPSDMSTPDSLGPGALLGRYRIIRRLGAGAMGIVFAAEHLDLRRPVALKIVRADPDGDGDVQQLRARLLREARAASAVRHPHVVTVHDVLELDDGSPVMVMDRLEGEPLRERLDRGPLSATEARTLADQLLSALECAHEAGIIHRDLKPDNVFLASRDGPEGIDARILDFGIAKLTAVDGPAAQTAGLTVTGMLVGTPHYMAPEQAFADPDLDARVDLWALGVIVYEALAGQRPIEGDNLGQLFRRLATMDIPPLDEVAPDVPPALADWVHHLLVERDRQFLVILIWGMYLSLLLFVSSNYWVWELGEAYPVKPVANLIWEHTPPGAEIYTSYPHSRPSLNFYSRRQIKPGDRQTLQQKWFNLSSPYLLLDQTALDTLELKNLKSLGSAEGWTLVTRSATLDDMEGLKRL